MKRRPIAMCLDPRKPESGAILATAGQSAPPGTIPEIREIAEDCVSAATRFEPGTPDFRRAADACATAYLAGRLEANAEIERLRAEVADLKIKILAAVSVLTRFADRLGVNDEDLAGMLADAQIRAEDAI